MGIEFDVQYASKQTHLPDKTLFQHWATAVLNFHEAAQTKTPQISAVPPSKSWTISLRIVDEVEGRQLNDTWRHRDYPTNVLSFPFENLPGMQLPFLGDIVICAPIVVQEAQQQGKSVEAHWAHLVTHGILHLLGYDHLEETQAQIMETLETDILHHLGYPNPY